MKTDNDNRIVRLLDQFFEGKTSPDEEAELERLISSTDHLPAGRENDCHAFTLCRKSDVAKVSAGLRERLEKAIENRSNEEELATKAKLEVGLRRRFVWASVAAAAVIALALIMPTLRHGHEPSIPADAHMALLSADSPKVETAAPKTTFSKSPTGADSAHEKTPATAAATNPVRKTPKTEAPPNQKAAATTSPTRIVDDPAEAAMYLARTFGLIERALRTTNQHIAECDHLLERAAQIIDNVSRTIRTTDNTPEQSPAKT